MTVPLPQGSRTDPASVASFSLLITVTLNSLNSKSKLRYERRSVGQSVFVSSSPSGAQNQNFIVVRQLRVCWCGPPSPRRRRVCLLQLLLALAGPVILGSESRGARDNILLSQIRDYPNREFESNREEEICV
jgi:hypothetical protein